MSEGERERCPQGRAMPGLGPRSSSSIERARHCEEARLAEATKQSRRLGSCGPRSREASGLAAPWTSGASHWNAQRWNRVFLTLLGSAKVPTDFCDSPLRPVASNPLASRARSSFARSPDRVRDDSISANYFPISSASSVCFLHNPPPYPPSAPLLLTTRWHGITMAMRLRPLALPPARTAPFELVISASCS